MKVGNELQDVRVAFVVANEGTEESELVRPWRVVVETMRHLDRSDRFPVDQLTDRASAADDDAVVLPGGVANPDRLRTDAPAVDFLMAMFEVARRPHLAADRRRSARRQVRTPSRR